MAAFDSLNDENGGTKAINEMIETRYGWSVDNETYGKWILRTEHEFNRNTNFTTLNDRLPDFFCEGPLPPNNGVFDISHDEIDKNQKENDEIN